VTSSPAFILIKKSSASLLYLLPLPSYHLIMTKYISLFEAPGEKWGDGAWVMLRGNPPLQRVAVANLAMTACSSPSKTHAGAALISIVALFSWALAWHHKQITSAAPNVGPAICSLRSSACISTSTTISPTKEIVTSCDPVHIFVCHAGNNQA
jgi:hypothetical protein